MDRMLTIVPIRSVRRHRDLPDVFGALKLGYLRSLRCGSINANCVFGCLWLDPALDFRSYLIATFGSEFSDS